MVEERYIVEGYSNLANCTLITEYRLNEQWLEVHRESFDIGSLSGKLEGYEEIDVTPCICCLTYDTDEKYRKIFYPKSKNNDGIWIKNNDQKIELPHFKNSMNSNLIEKLEPVYENSAETHFFIEDEFGEIIGCPELTESLNRMNDDIMYFNFNWIPKEFNPTPLKKVLELMNKKIEAEIIFHDVESVVVYKIKLIGFRFERIYNLRNYDWNDNGIKELAVQYNFDKEQIIIK